MTILDKIVETKKTFIESLPEIKNESELRKRKTNSLTTCLEKEFVTIHEYKRKTPSSGDLGNPPIIEQVQRYVDNKAKVISILTDEPYFGGTYDDLQIVRKTFPDLILLNKEFIISTKQIDYAKVYGADVILLIAKILSPEQILMFYNHAKKLDLDVLVEIHDKPDLDKLNQVRPEIIGINNRNLEDFSVSLETTTHLKKQINYPCKIISESGIHTKHDLDFVKKHADGALIGTAFMKGDLLNVI